MTAAGWLQATQRLQARAPAWAGTWPVWTGGLALALAAALGTGLAPRWQAQAEARLALLGAPLPQPVAQAPARPSALPATRPGVVDSPRRAAALAASAHRHGLELLQLREQLDASARLQLGMNGRGSYAALRAFVERALAGDAALILDSLRLQRNESDGTLVSFELRWTLLHQGSNTRLLGPAPAGPGP